MSINSLKTLSRHFLAVLLIQLFACFNSHAGENPFVISDAEQQWLSQHPVITLGVDKDLMPLYITNESGDVSGILIDIVRHLEGLLNIDIKLKPGPWQQMQQQARQKQVDGLMAMSKTGAELNQLLPSKPYTSFYTNVYAREDADFELIDISDLAGMVVAYDDKTVAARAMLKPLSEQYGFELIAAPNPLSAMQLVQEGAANVFFGFSFNNYLKRKYLLNDLKLIYADYERPIYAVAGIRNDWPEFVKLFDRAMSHIGESEIRSIFNKWLRLDEEHYEFILSPTERQRLAQYPVWQHVILDDRFPTEDVDSNGIYRGMSATYFELLEEKLGVRFENVFVTSMDEMKAHLSGDKPAIASFVSKAWADSNAVSTTNAYLQYPLTVYVRESTPILNSLYGLKGKRVSFVESTPAVETMAGKIPEAEFLTNNTPLQVFYDLADERTDAVILTNYAADYILRKFNIDGIKVGYASPYSSSMYMGVSQHLGAVLPIINRAIASVSETETRLIMEKWAAIPIVHEVDWQKMTSWIVAIVFSLGLVIFFILYWNRRLSREIDRRKIIEKALLDAKQQAEIASAAKSAFLANMSHEIRTPMNGVLGMAELLEGTELDKTQQHYLETIKKTGKTLLTVINDILDNAKIEAGKFDLELSVFNFKSLVDSVLAPFKFRQSQHLNLLVDYDASIPDFLVGDEVRLQQVLVNLLSNAFKFTDQGEVVVSFHLTAKTADKVTILCEVADSGIGISDEQQQQLFNPFTQADQSTSRKYGGTGLGLSICRQLLALMGTELKLESTLERGSKFSFAVTLSIATDNSMGKQKGAVIDTRQIDRSQLRVLLVEDNQVNQMVAQGLIKKLGIRDLTVVSDGEQAVEIVKNSSPFDVIFMDCEMPGMDGYQATRLIRQWEQQAGMPRHFICALTAHALAEQRQRCEDVGMDDHLAKPFSAADIEKLLGRERLAAK
jgi:polar amino acid transport system substrate-binding protein/two-component system sensor histidine kinase EvgS